MYEGIMKSNSKGDFRETESGPYVTIYELCHLKSATVKSQIFPWS